jgi:alkylation response protein AidB-like acyl-CoA dehydrogenase
VYVDAGRLVGGVEGQGLLQAQAVFGYTRLMVAAFGLGAGWAALDRAIPYSAKRIQAGSPLSEKQGYTHKLIVPNVARLEAGRASIEETAERIDAGEGNLNTEGAIAKYMSTEAGNLAADASIQALGGYGYTHEYMVEKISRDVRITTIYEGTSEIMEMTISRDRWQLHLKTRGRHYHDRAREFEALDARHPDVGAGCAALALHALAEVMERARIGRLTRYQHILLRLGEWIAFAECAGSLARRAALLAEGRLNEKANQRFDAPALAAISRIFARDAALRVAQEGLRWIVGAGRRDGGRWRGGRFRGGAESFSHSPRSDRADSRYGFCCRRALRQGQPGRRARRLERSGRLQAFGPTRQVDPARWRKRFCLRSRKHTGERKCRTQPIEPSQSWERAPSCPMRRTSRRFGRTSRPGATASAKSHPTGGTRRSTMTPTTARRTRRIPRSVAGSASVWEPLKWRLAIPPRVAEAMDEAQRWAIACTREALADYGYPERPLNTERTAVILGNAMAGEKHYFTVMRALFPEYSRELDESATFPLCPRRCGATFRGSGAPA